MRRRLIAAVLVAAMVVVGCSSDDGTTEPAGAPAGEGFYRPPDPLPDGEPGDVIWASTIAAPEGARGWRILYRSTTVKGEPVAVSALLFAPKAQGAGKATPIVAWAHGTTGLGDQCAPSKTFDARTPTAEATAVTIAVREGYAIVATDYEGLGTPGVHPWVVGLSEGRNVLDSIRAAQRFPDIGTTSESDSVVWGHSQGGGAALVAAELAPTYAPDANVTGAAAGAPAAELKFLGGAAGGRFLGFLLMAGAGFRAAYPELDFGRVLTTKGLEALDTVSEQCVSDAVEAFRDEDAGAFVKADFGVTEPFASIVEENSPGVRATDVPIFLYHGDADDVIPPVTSKLVLDRYCRNGTTASRRTYTGGTHGGVIALALGDIESFLADRLNGKPAPSDC